MAGLCLKFIGALARFYVSSSVYGTGDSFDYDKWGRTIASGLRHGHLIPLGGRLAGTDFMRYVTGFIYFVTPARMLSGFAVYSWLSFVGLIFFWRAYRVAISPKYDVTYLQWILLMPSLVYWPSAIGKDAFMLLAAGIAAYGAACLFVNRTTVGLDRDLGRHGRDDHGQAAVRPRGLRRTRTRRARAGARRRVSSARS